MQTSQTNLGIEAGPLPLEGKARRTVALAHKGSLFLRAVISEGVETAANGGAYGCRH